MTKFDEGWWNCFNSFANNCYMTKGDKLSACYEVLDGAGVTKEEALHVLNKKDILYGGAIGILEHFITLEE